MARTAVLGFPRIGADRELKVALEEHWAGRTTAAELEATARGAARRAPADRAARRHRRAPRRATSRSTTTCSTRPGSPGSSALRAPPRRARLLRAARGADGVRPLEMTKWLDTNYHYLVPELRAGPAVPRWRRRSGSPTSREARALGVHARPVVLGPLSLLLLAKGAARPARAAAGAVPRSTRSCCGELAAAGATRGAARRAVPGARPLRARSSTRSRPPTARSWPAPGSSICLATYFAGLAGAALARVAALRAGRAARRPRARAGAARRRARRAPRRATRLSLGRRRRAQRLGDRPRPRRSSCSTRGRARSGTSG